MDTIKEIKGLKRQLHESNNQVAIAYQRGIITEKECLTKQLDNLNEFNDTVGALILQNSSF